MSLNASTCRVSEAFRQLLSFLVVQLLLETVYYRLVHLAQCWLNISIIMSKN